MISLRSLEGRNGASERIKKESQGRILSGKRLNEFDKS